MAWREVAWRSVAKGGSAGWLVGGAKSVRRTGEVCSTQFSAAELEARDWASVWRAESRMPLAMLTVDPPPYLCTLQRLVTCSWSEVAQFNAAYHVPISSTRLTSVREARALRATPNEVPCVIWPWRVTFS